MNAPASATLSRDMMAVQTLRDRAGALAAQLAAAEEGEGEALRDALILVAAMLAEQAEALVALHHRLDAAAVSRFAAGGSESSLQGII